MRHVESATPLSLDPDSTLPVSLTHPVTSTSSDEKNKTSNCHYFYKNGTVIMKLFIQKHVSSVYDVSVLKHQGNSGMSDSKIVY